MPDRIYNFSAGPATLPYEVLVQVAKDLVNFNNKVIGLIEMSHRSKEFIGVVNECESLLRELMRIPDNYKVLFLQGGASTQFAMVPMNLLQPGKSATYLNTGTWSKKAIKEAKLFGDIDVAYSSEDTIFDRVPLPDEYQVAPNAEYLYFVSNNTIYGTQFHQFPETDTDLVCDMSSDILARTVDVSRFGIILKGSMFNTPPCFSIYTIGLVLKWLKNLGGLTIIEKMNLEKAGLLYQAIDNSDFYTGHARHDSRSIMNVTFNLPTPELEAQFIKDAAAASFDGLKGHRSVGGCRASIYNAFPRDGVEKLVDFMIAFEKKNN
jgi:phosphoserine aminotransferase